MHNKKPAGQQQSLEGPKGPWDRALVHLRNALTAAVCFAILAWFDVFRVMWYSQRVLHPALYISYVAHAAMAVCGLYLSWVVSPRDPLWEQTQQPLIRKAAAAFAVGTLTWMVGVWPVYHLWTIPLSICFLFGSVSLLMLMPSSPKAKLD
jgi:archaellum biogenesis protein FlaJ (TadC family)